MTAGVLRLPQLPFLNTGIRVKNSTCRTRAIIFRSFPTVDGREGWSGRLFVSQERQVEGNSRDEPQVKLSFLKNPKSAIVQCPGGWDNNTLYTKTHAISRYIYLVTSALVFF